MPKGGEDIGPDGTHASRPVEVTLLEFARPVVAGCRIQINHAAVTQLGGGIHALQLGAVAALNGLEGRVGGFDVGICEFVGSTLQVATEALNAVVTLVKTRAQHAAQVPAVLAEVFVDLGKGLGIELAVAHVAQAVVAVL